MCCGEGPTKVINSWGARETTFWEAAMATICATERG
jgi:hypothetical protein